MKEQIKLKTTTHYMTNVELWGIIQAASDMVRLQCAIDSLPSRMDSVRDGMKAAKDIAEKTLIAKIDKTQES